MRIRSVLNANDSIQLIARKQWVIALPFLGYALNNQSANPCTIGILYTFWGFCSPCTRGVDTMLLLGRTEKEVPLHCPGHRAGVRWGKGHNLLRIHHVLSVSLFFVTSILFCLLFNHSQGWLAFCLTCLHYTLLQSIWQAEISRRRHVLLSVRAGGREGDQASQLQPQPGRQTEIQPKKLPPDAWVLFPSRCPLPSTEQQVKVFLPLPAQGGQAGKPSCGKISTESSFFFFFLQWWKEEGVGSFQSRELQEWGTHTFTLCRTITYGHC